MQNPLGYEIERAARLFRRAHRAIALSGAGVSVPSGIPDFRSPVTGLWDHAQALQVASIFGFLEDPRVFFEWVRPIARMISAAQPNPAHRALAELERRGMLRAILTQNIDDLHQRAGSRRVLELHGHMREATCMRCYRLYPARELLAQFIRDGEIPRCVHCGGVVKPNVVLYGEMLPMRTMEEAEREVDNCDLMIVAGSSLQVSPAADMPFRAQEHGASLIIANLGPTPLDKYADVVVRANVAETLPRIVAAIVDP